MDVKSFRNMLYDFGLLKKAPEECNEIIKIFKENNDSGINAMLRLYDEVYMDEFYSFE